MAKRGRKPVLDDAKRREILALLWAGCSRSTAAEYVGCHRATIRNTADRDAEFAKKIGRAERQQEVSCLNLIRRAAENQQHWRAAAWMLERKYPREYARRGPDVITVDEIRELVVQLSEILVEEIPEARHRRAALKRLMALSVNLGKTRARRKKTVRKVPKLRHNC